MSPRPYIEFQDLVLHTPTSQLAFIDRVAGDSSDDDDDDYSGDAASDDSASTTDERGRLTRWVAGAPSATSPRKRKDSSGRALISRYDDDDNEADDEEPPPPAEYPDGTVPKELPEGTAVLTLISSGEKVVRSIEDLRPLDRHFDPGQIVTWAPDAPDLPPERPTQSGIVERVSKTVVVRHVNSITPSTVERPDPATCFEVPTERLGFFCGIRAGDMVVRGSWVGVLDYFQEDVFVEFSDGAIAVVPGHRKALRNIDSRTPDRTRPDPFSEGMYYPGQRVRSLPDVWKSIAVWVRGGYTGKDEGVVKSVKVGDVGVEWVAKSMYAGPNDADILGGIDPQERGVDVMRFSDVTMLTAFRNIWWTVGDRGILLNDGASTSQTAASGGNVQRTNVNSLPTFSFPEDDEDGEWEEEDISESPAGPSSQAEAPSRFLSRNRAARKQGGRLMKAQRKARERGGNAEHIGTVSDAAIANSSAGPEDVVQVVGSTLRVTVLWQDGTRSENIRALNFKANNHPDPYDFWPGEIVFRPDEETPKNSSGASGDGSGPNDKRKGAVVKVNQNERTAVVRWENADRSAYEEEEEVSVYELKTDEYDVNVGDTVLHTPKEATPSEKRKEWVGVILNESMGECEVAWYGGTVSSVPTRELLYIHGADEEAFEEDDEDEFSAAEAEVDHAGDMAEQGEMSTSLANTPQDPEYRRNWGMDEETDQSPSDRTFMDGERVLLDLINASGMTTLSGVEEKAVDQVFFSTIQDAEDMLESNRKGGEDAFAIHISPEEERLVAMRMVGGALSRLSELSLKAFVQRKSSDPEQGREQFDSFVKKIKLGFSCLMAKEAELRKERSGRLHESFHTWMKGNDVCHRCAENNAPQQNGITDRMQEDPPSTDTDDLANGSFQMVEGLENFHAFQAIPKNFSAPQGFLSVVRKEWSRLQKNLPPGVFVWTSEQEVNKVRAGVIGAEGTPYADIMFFFDIGLGPNYPMSPPVVWFHSHGRRINPNLYEDGKVCLSILGTWDGDDVESWDAKTSNLLRVLLSLQALVFVEEPYFNEAGYSKQRGTEEGRANSQKYNESAYLLCMRHAVQTLKQGGVPEDCMKIAVAHYRKAANGILARCRRLLNHDAASASSSGASSTSAGFRKSLQTLIPALEQAFSGLDRRV